VATCALQCRMISSRFVAGNLLDRQFTAEAPNQRWVGDTTEFVIGESGKLYLAAILDLYSRFIVGWAVSAVNDRHLTIKALEMALKRRCPEVGLLHHSDQGCTYASEDYQAVLETHGITCSMSRRRNCHDCEHDLVAVRPGLTPAMNDFVSWR
jgi:putative transposase